VTREGRAPQQSTCSTSWCVCVCVCVCVRACVRACVRVCVSSDSCSSVTVDSVAMCVSSRELTACSELAG
jgi:hypothetical protein